MLPEVLLSNKARASFHHSSHLSSSTKRYFLPVVKIAFFSQQKHRKWSSSRCSRKDNASSPVRADLAWIRLCRRSGLAPGRWAVTREGTERRRYLCVCIRKTEVTFANRNLVPFSPSAFKVSSQKWVQVKSFVQSVNHLSSQPPDSDTFGGFCELDTSPSPGR